MRRWATQALGPGLIMAGAAIGVSHLVQSTRAGAQFGTSLVVLILLACLFKYPFLEFGPRYAAATGESMLVGFRRLGRLAIFLFAFITLATMLVILASITLVTAGLLGVVFDLSLTPAQLSVGVLLLCVSVLMLGQYRGLDLGMKLVILVLMLTTVIATVMAINQLPNLNVLSPTAHWNDIWTAGGIAFVLALLGWMPIPLDVAVWHSIWTLEQAHETQHHPRVIESIRDFQLGYGTATVSAVIFVLLGAAVLGGQTLELPSSALAFSETLIRLYTQSLGTWSNLLIGAAALSAMISTTLAVCDAYPRVLHGLWAVTFKPAKSPRPAEPHHRGYVVVPKLWYGAILILLSMGALVIIIFFGHQFTRLIDFTTTVSFLSAPILGWLSYRLITSPWVPEEHRPSTALRALSIAGLVFLIGFCLVWTLWRWA